MMDVRCRECGEAWDLDTLHEEVACRGEAGTRTTFQRVYREFRRIGCAALWAFGARDCRGRGHRADPAIGAILDLNGDDCDGAASDLEDLA